MNRRFTLLATSIAFGAVIALTTPVLAQGEATQQTQPSAGQQMPMGPGMGYGRMGRGAGQGMMYGRGGRGCRGGMGGMMGVGRGYGMMYHTEGSLAFLKAELKITDKQKEAWDKFAKAMRDSANLMRAAMQSHMTEGPPKTLMERLDRQEAMMASRLESLRSTRAALVPLYQALDAAQKQTLDDMMAPCRSGSGTAPEDDDSGE